MRPEKIKEMIDACYLAKRIRDMLPALPSGVSPSFIQYLDTIRRLEDRNGRVRVGDVSEALGLPRPGVTRKIKEMEAKGYLKKAASGEDGRMIQITITEAGKALSDKYDCKYYGRLSGYLSDIPEEDADCMIRTIRALYQVMNERRIDLDA